MMRKIVLAPLLAICAHAQTSIHKAPKKVLTPEQMSYQQEERDYAATLGKLRMTAIAAFSAELARDKTPVCPNAGSTYELNSCLDHEIEVTNTNYKTFIAALRAMLLTPEPTVPGAPTPIVGPTGEEATPATNIAAFDAAESAWQTYAKAECSAVDTYWRGGTIVNAMVGECSLRMSRSRLRELNDAYEATIHPH